MRRSETNRDAAIKRQGAPDKKSVLCQVSGLQTRHPGFERARKNSVPKVRPPPGPLPRAEGELPPVPLAHRGQRFSTASGVLSLKSKTVGPDAQRGRAAILPLP